MMLAMLAALGWVDSFTDCEARYPYHEVHRAAIAAGMMTRPWAGLGQGDTLLEVHAHRDGAWVLVSVWRDGTACIRASGHASTLEVGA